jgi:hypothetical protein
MVPAYRDSNFEGSGKQLVIEVCNCIFAAYEVPSILPHLRHRRAPHPAPHLLHQRMFQRVPHPTLHLHYRQVPPSNGPTSLPTSAPSSNPTSRPTSVPTSAPSNTPSKQHTIFATNQPPCKAADCDAYNSSNVATFRLAVFTAEQCTLLPPLGPIFDR